MIINHGDILSDRILTHYTHMMPYASEELKEKTKRKKIIRRGDIIGQGTAHFKIFMYRAGLIGDMDNYGHRMGYMEYWDGKTELDYPLKLVKEKIEFK